ncbi:hypothetical protein N0X72_25365 [Streptomyces carpaticus]|uniref:hypothetical protein n=1 Tax=Streptomyces carpaticus TaxID=285558 RepID=UPI0021FE2EDC|nr:hypothetical protein N0X72_25365 [Streptomyces carpaticus]
MPDAPTTPPAPAAPQTGDPATPPAPAPAPAGPQTTPPAPPAGQLLADATTAAETATAERDQALAALDAIRAALNPGAEGGDQDPARLAESAAAARDQALADVRRLTVELAAHQAAATHGADPARLLDSRAVARQLADLDPADQGFAAALDTVIKTAVDGNPTLRAQAPAGPPRGGADFNGGPPPATTPEQFRAMSYGQRVELHQSDPDLYRQLAGSE